MSDDAELTPEPGSEGSVETPPAVAADERDSLARAREVIERLLDDVECRRAILTFFAQSISVAHANQPAAWGITLYRDRVRLSLGGAVACTVMRGSIWVVVDSHTLDAPTTARLEQLREWHVGTHKTVRGSASAYVDCAEGDEVLPLLAPAHHALIAALSKRSEQASVRLQGAHAEGVIQYLRSAGFPDLPSPAYDGGIPQVDPARIEEAFATFDQEYRETSEWRSWERDPKNVYVIEREGRRYPVKAIVRIATGATKFESRQARAYLMRRGYQIDSRDQAPYRAWLFQANPRYYDLADRLRRAKVGDEDVWTVTRYGNVMQAGDPVLLWLSGEQAGIYAVGELLGPPAERTYAPGEAPPWLTVHTSSSPTSQ
jgi:hypothetical protein